MKILIALSVVAFALASAIPAFSSPITVDAGGPYTFYLGDVLTLDASGSTPSDCGTPDASYQWDLNNDGTYDLNLGYGQAVVDLDPVDYASFFPTAGDYPISLYYGALMDCVCCGWESGSDSTTVTALTENGGPGPSVPEPATFLLLGSGLIGLAGFGRKKVRKS